MDSFIDTLKHLGPVRLGIMGAILAGLLLFFTFVSMRISTPNMQMLYSELSSMDSSAIAAKLEAESIVYKVSPDGTQIFTSEDEIGRARMLLAEAGLPNGGSMGYEIFDQSSGFGTTNFVQNINQVRALEGELSRTIISLNGIRSARVHLVLPQRELFSREKRSASASVFLGLNGGAQIDQEKINAIQSLVASAVPDLSAESVAIVDNNGSLLASSEGRSINRTSAKIEEMRLSHENRLINKIEDQLNRVVGYGKVRATVTAEMNFDRVSMNEELFDPTGQVVRSTQVTEESSLERESAGGDADDVSIGNNLPNVGNDLLSDPADPSAEDQRLEELTNYEISKTIRSTVKEIGEIKRLSVAVLVDGRYTKDENGDNVYTPRSEAELKQIETLVRSAVGFDNNRGDQIEIVNLQFAQIDTNEAIINDHLILGFEKNKILDMAEIITVAVMIILVVILVLQPMVNKLLETAPIAASDSLNPNLLESGTTAAGLLTADGTNALSYPAVADASNAEGIPAAANDTEGDEALINVHGVEGKVKASTLKKIDEIIDNYPTETLSVIRGWMTQEKAS